MWCLFFFFKQKTAYEMRISDWSSDVCSSDLNTGFADAEPFNAALAADQRFRSVNLLCLLPGHSPEQDGVALAVRQIGRASCRERVCSTCRSRWSPYHETNK